jgi:hypothetical protein
MSSCCNTTGIVIDTNSLRMGSVPNLWSVKIVNNMPRLWRAGLTVFRFRTFFTDNKFTQKLPLLQAQTVYRGEICEFYCLFTIFSG